MFFRNRQTKNKIRQHGRFHGRIFAGAGALVLLLSTAAFATDITISSDTLYQSNNALPPSVDNLVIAPGGKLSVYGVYTFPINGNFTLQEGGNLHVSGSSGGKSQGILYVNGAVNIDGTAVFDNVHPTLLGTDGKPLADDSYRNAAPGIYAYGDNGTVTISGNANFSNAYLSDGSSGYGSGSAIYAKKGITFTEDSVTRFEKNSANQLGTLYALGSIILAGNATFTSNSAGNGGAIALGDAFYDEGNPDFPKDAFLDISGKNTFTGNRATSGGAIYSRRSVSISGETLFDGNLASSTADAGTGGALYLSSSRYSTNLTIDGTTTFTNNTANIQGGAAFVAGTTTISGTTVFENNAVLGGVGKDQLNNPSLWQANGFGGALSTTGNIAIGGTTTFLNNTAGSGGAIYTSGNIALSGNTNFTDNVAINWGGKDDKSWGGAIYSMGGSLTLSGTTNFIDNGHKFLENEGKTTFIAKKGGAIFAKTGNITISGETLFSGNTATEGGAIFMERSSTGGATPGVLTLAPESGKTITFATATDSIDGQGYVVINGPGNVVMNANNTYTLQDATGYTPIPGLADTTIRNGNITLNAIGAFFAGGMTSGGMGGKKAGTVNFSGGNITLNAAGTFANYVSGAANGQNFNIANNVTLVSSELNENKGSLNDYYGTTSVTGAHTLTLGAGAGVGGDLNMAEGSTLEIYDNTNVGGTLTFGNNTTLQAHSLADNTTPLMTAGSISFAGVKTTSLVLDSSAVGYNYSIPLIDLGSAAAAQDIVDSKYLSNTYHGGIVTQQDGVLYAQYSILDLTWNGGADDNVWNSGNLTNKNWLTDAGDSEYFAMGDHVLFGDTAATRNVAVDGTVAPGVAQVTADNYSFTGINNAVISPQAQAFALNGRNTSFSNLSFANALNGSAAVSGDAAFSGVNFTSNKGTDGAALWNSGTAALSNTTFTGNTASGNGGAIYNSGDMTFNGTTVFSSNTAAGLPNDIHNTGNLRFASANVTLDGGITGNGTVFITGGSTFNLGTAVLAARSFQMDSGTLGLTIEGSASANNYGKIAADTISITGGTLDLAISAPDGSYPLLDGTTLALGYNLKYASDMFTVVDNKNGIFAISTNRNMSVGNENQNSMAAGLRNYVNAGGANSAIKNVLMELQTNRNSGLRNLDNMMPTSSQALASLHASTADRLFEYVSDRTEAQKNLADDEIKPSSAVWTQVFYNHAKQNKTATDRRFGFNTLGFVVGADTRVTEDLALGLAYSYGRSNIDSADNKIDGNLHSFLGYARQDWGKWSAVGEVHFAYATYDEDKSILGSKYSADYNSKALGARVRVGYDFDCGIRPEAGLRYQHVQFSNYTDSLGQHVHSKALNTLTAVLGATYKKSFATSNGTVTPKVYLAGTWDIANKDGVSVVDIPGATYQSIGSKQSRLGAEGGLAIDWQNGDWTLSGTYKVNVREKFNSHGFTLNALYRF